MQRSLFYHFLLLVLCSLSLPLSGLAQTITVGTVSTTAVCSGNTVSIPFSVTGTFGSTNVFTAQLSDATGTFGTSSSTNIGTLSASSSTTAATALTILATIPAGTATSTAYQVRVISSNPFRTSSNSARLAITNTPGMPGVSPVSYCLGEPAAPLSASAVSGATLKWYTVASDETASSVAPTPDTKKTGIFPYYVSQSLNGCESSRAQITVTVNGTPSPPTVQASFADCQNATLAPLTATADNGNTLRWYAPDTNGGTYSSTAPTPDNQKSAVYYVSQASGNCPSAPSSITVTINKAPSAPTVSAPQPYCPGQTASPLSATAAAGGTLNWYGTNATGGTPSSTATIPNTSTTRTENYYVSQTVNGCESARAGIAVTVKPAPSAPVVSTPIGLCLNKSVAPLTATPSTNGTLNWYATNATGEIPTTTAPTPSVTATGTTLYYVSQTVNSCESQRAPIAVTVNTVPGLPTVQSPGPFCQGTSLSALSATPTTGATLRWYGTNATDGSASTTAPIPDNQKSATYYVSQLQNGCESQRASISVTINPRPTAPTVASAPSYCPGQTAVALAATPSTGGTLNWYGTNASDGVSSTSATVPSTTASATYYVSQTVNGCESTRASISVLVKPTPAAPSVSNLSLCQNRSANALTASGVSGSTINWYGTSQTGIPSTTAPTPSVTATGSTPYYVSQTVNDCESSKATLTVTVNAVPAVPTVAATGPTYCQGVSAQPLSATGTALLWYGTNQAGGTGNSTATIPSTGSTGQTTYYVTQTASGCESDRAGVTVTVKQTPARPDVVNVTFCQNTNAPGLTATASSGATLNWYGTNQTGGTRTDSPPSIPTNTATTYTYYVSQTLDGCESASRAAITAQVKPTPGAPTVTPVAYCNNAGSQQLSAGGSNIRWYDASGSALSGAPTPPTNNVGQQTYQATQTVDGCESQQKATLTVTIKPLPGQPGVTNLSYCQPTQDQPTQNVGALTASGENLRWYNTDGNSFQSAPTPPISQTGTYTYQVSQTVNGCEGGKATLQVAVNSTIAPIVSTSLVTYCINTTATPLQATATTGASLRWIDPYNRTFSDAPIPSTLNSNVTPGGDPFYVYQIGANGCYSPRSTIRVVVNVAPTLALNGTGEVNLGSLAPVKLSFTGAPPFSYTLTDGYSGISRTNDTTIYVLPRGNTTYQIVSVANSCGVGLPGNPATATITVRVPTIATSVLQTSTVCAGSSFAVPFTTTGQFTAGNLFTAELVSVADTSRKINVSPNGTTGSVVTAAIPLTVAAGQYYVRVKGSNPSVGIVGSNSPSVLTVRARATATLTGTQSIYEGSPATLTLTLGGEAPWTVTYADSLRSYTVTAASSPYALGVQPARTTTYQLTSVSNNCGVGTATSSSAVVTVQKVLGVEDPSLGPLVNIYPIPTGATLTVDIDVSLIRDPALLTLHDTSGRPVLNQTTRSRQTTLDVNQQPAGTYLLRIQIGDRQVVRRILKQ